MASSKSVRARRTGVKALTAMAGLLALDLPDVAFAQTWNVDADGRWNVAANWSPQQVPSGVGASATFGPVITAPRTIDPGGLTNFGSLSFSGDNGYTLASPGGLWTLRANAVSGNSTITATGGAVHSLNASELNVVGTLTINSNGAGLSLLGSAGGGFLTGGDVTVKGTGPVTLRGQPYHSGSLTIAPEATLIADTALSAQTWSPSKIQLDGKLVLSNADITTSAVISGTGSIVVRDNSYLRYDGTSPLAGGVKLDTGGSFTFSGSATGNIATTTSADTVRMSSTTVDNLYSGEMSGAGSLVVYHYSTAIGGREFTLTLTGNNTYTGGTRIDLGTLQVGDGGTTGMIGPGKVNIPGDGRLRFNRSDDIAFDGDITMGGLIPKVEQAGSGTLTLKGNVTGTASNGGSDLGARSGKLIVLGTVNTQKLTVDAGAVVQLGNGGTQGEYVPLDTGFTSGPIYNQGTFIVNRSDKSVMAGWIEGTGEFHNDGPGTTVLTGTNTHTGGTFVNAGTLQIGDGTDSAGGLKGSIAGNVTIAKGATLAFNRARVGAATPSQPLTGGTVSGAGQVHQMAGVTDLTVPLNHTGGTIIDQGGTLSVNSSGSLGTSDIVNSGTLQFDLQGGSTSYGGVISGTGEVITYNGGINNQVTLTGNNTYTGRTTVNRWLNIGNGGTSGTLGALGAAGAADTTVAGILVFNRSDDFTHAGRIYFNGTSGFGGTMRKLGAGTLTLSGSIGLNTFTGLVEVKEGRLLLTGDNKYNSVSVATHAILQVGDGEATGTLAAAAVDNSGTVVFNRPDRLAFGSAISGTGSVQQIGAGRLVLSRSSSYSGGTSISRGGTIEVSRDDNLGATSGSLAIDNGTLATTASFGMTRTVTLGAGGGTFDVGGNTLTLGGTVSGGKLTARGALGAHGTLVLAADNTYGDTAIEAGATLQVGTGLATGTLGSGAIRDDGVLAVKRAGTLEIGRVIEGSGALDQRGPGTLVLTANNRYTGGTTITAGTLQLGNGGSSGWVEGDIANNGTLVFNRSDAVAFDRVIRGTGGVIQRGTGSVNLTGTNTYIGPTVVEAGTLRVNGSITSDTTVLAAGTLGGTGTITGAVVNRGTIAPGNSIGQLNIVGSYTQAAGSFYQVEINPAGSADRISVTGAPGTATIQGGTITVLAANGVYPLTYKYTVVTATGGVTGTYAGVTSNLAFVKPKITYDANNVYLEVSATNPPVDPTDPTGPAVPTVQFRRGATTANQAAVACALDQVAPFASGAFVPVVGALMGLDTSQGPAALDALSGVSYAGFGTANLFAGNLFAKQLREAMAVTRGGGDDRDGHGWGGGFGGTGTVSGTSAAATCGGAVPSQAPSQVFSAAGFAAGLDARLNPSVLVGLGIGYASGSEWTGGVSSRGASDSVMAGAYASFTRGGAYADLLAGVALNANQMTRTVTIPGLGSRVAHGTTTAPQWFGQAELGYRIGLEGASASTFTPFARFEASTVAQNGFTEWGADGVNLAVAGQATSTLRSVLGAEFTAAYDVGWSSPLAVQVRLGWAHDYADMTRPVTAAFAAAPGASFTVLGATPPRDSASLGLGLSTVFNERYRLFLRYEGDIAAGADSHAINVGVRFSW
ncbi:MAG: autotransporter domain-containing protein [Proteobacteria bacterium]|nr:autotransporter domain-containing protein [Pseudomonadota bacterium]